MADFRRRSTSSLNISNDLRNDSKAGTHVLNKIQNSLREMTGNRDLEQLDLATVPSDFFFFAVDESLYPKDYDE